MAVAAAFNRLSHYPDDATIAFDFNFGIKALVAIAPIDGQYEPANRPTPLENVNYLVIHGSHDGDVSAFSGLRQYSRIQFTDGQPWFKSAVWMYRANHGQWNTVWGSTDGGPASPRFLDLRGLVPPEEQRQMAEVYLAGFLEATLKGKTEYLPIFRDHRVIGAWLPQTMYLTRFMESGFHALASYGGRRRGEHRHGARGDASRRRAWPPGRKRCSRSAGRTPTPATTRVWLGWNNRIAGTGYAEDRKARFLLGLTLGDSLRSAWGVGQQGTALEFLAGADLRHARAPCRGQRHHQKGRHEGTTKGAKPAPKPPSHPPRKIPDRGRFAADADLDRGGGRRRHDRAHPAQPVRRASAPDRSDRAPEERARQDQFRESGRADTPDLCDSAGRFSGRGTGIRSRQDRDGPVGVRRHPCGDRGAHRYRPFQHRPGIPDAGKALTSMRRAGITLFGLLTAAGGAAAQSHDPAPLVLQLPGGTRALGVGNAFVAGRGAEVLFYNPAQMFILRGTTLSVERFGSASTLGTLSIVGPFGKVHLGAGVQYLDYDALPSISFFTTPSALTQEGTASSSSLAATVAVAAQWKGVRFGGSAKYVEERVGGSRAGVAEQYVGPAAPAAASGLGGQPRGHAVAGSRTPRRCTTSWSSGSNT